MSDNLGGSRRRGGIPNQRDLIQEINSVFANKRQVNEDAPRQQDDGNAPTTSPFFGEIAPYYSDRNDPRRQTQYWNLSV